MAVAADLPAVAPGALVRHAVFPRSALGYVAERRRLRYFPAATRRMPELREAFLYRKLFLNKATAEFDLALAGAALAAATRSRKPLALAAPFALRIAKIAAPHGRTAPLVAATELAAYAVGAYSLAIGTISQRTPVL